MSSSERYEKPTETGPLDEVNLQNESAEKPVPNTPKPMENYLRDSNTPETSDLDNKINPVEEAPAPRPNSGTNYKNVTIDKKTSSISETGGEWELLKKNIFNWLQENGPQKIWDRFSQPILVLSGLLALILVIQIYSSVLSSISRIPLASRLFEITGASWFAWFTVSKLIRSDGRQEVISSLRKRWQSFSSKKDRSD